MRERDYQKQPSRNGDGDEGSSDARTEFARAPPIELDDGCRAGGLGSGHANLSSSLPLPWVELKRAERSLVAAERLLSALQLPCFDAEDRLLAGAHVNAARMAVLKATDGLAVMSKKELNVAKRVDEAEQRRKALVQASKEGILQAEDDIFHILVRKQLHIQRALAEE